MSFSVELVNIHKQFGSTSVLKGISLSIPQGSFFGLLGPNGAGKSTLIGVLSGLVKADTGEARVMGHDVVSDFRQARRALGLVPQELIDEPFFPIRKLLRVQAGYFGLGQSHWDWIDTLLQKLGLWDKRDVALPALSGGMKRRVMIALALVHKPPVVVLDEPTAGVDVELRLGLWSFIRELHAQGHTIILTTHYLEEAEALCEQIAIMREGQLLALAKTEQLLASHPWTFIELTLSHLPDVLPEWIVTRLHRQTGNRVVVRVARDSDDRAMIATHLAQAGIALIEMKSLEASLEDVFRSLTNTGETL